MWHSFISIRWNFVSCIKAKKSSDHEELRVKAYTWWPVLWLLSYRDHLFFTWACFQGSQKQTSAMMLQTSLFYFLAVSVHMHFPVNGEVLLGSGFRRNDAVSSSKDSLQSHKLSFEGECGRVFSVSLLYCRIHTSSACWPGVSLYALWEKSLVTSLLSY